MTRSAGSWKSVVGSLIGCLGAVVGSAPLLYMVVLLLGMWFGLMTVEDRPVGIRPMELLIFAGALSVFGLIVCCPLAALCSYLAARLGAEFSARLARYASVLFLFPIPVSVILLWTMSLTTGIQLD